MADHIQPATYTVPEAAIRLGLHPDSVYARVNSGEWPHTRLTRKISFTEDQIQQILKMGAQAPKPATRPRRRAASA